VVQRSVAALGLAVRTAMLTSQRAQLMADRSARLRPDQAMPSIGAAGLPGPPGGSTLAAHYALYQATSARVFVAAVDNLYLVTAWLTLVGVGLALLLRSNVFRRDEAGTGTEPASAARSGDVRPAGASRLEAAH
jgi:hypothetical protein